MLNKIEVYLDINLTSDKLKLIFNAGLNFELNVINQNLFYLLKK